jgi:hypothetical protein
MSSQVRLLGLLVEGVCVYVWSTVAPVISTSIYLHRIKRTRAASEQ